MSMYDLNTHIFRLPDKSSWSVRDAVRGLQIFGSIGSGKSSGSGEFIARKYLKLGWGGLVLCAKPEEAQAWIKYAIESGRQEHEIIHFCEGSKYLFNPLKYETERTTKGGGLTFNLTELFMSIFKMGQRITGSDSEEQERYWENAMKRLINRVIDLIKLSGEQMTIENMVNIVSTIPVSLEMVADIKNKRKTERNLDGKAKEKAQKEWTEFLETNLCIRCLETACDKLTQDSIKDFELVFNYFYRDFPLLDEKAQSTIKEMFLGFAEPFLSGILQKHFSSGTNITPEDSFQGKIIILDFSVMEYLVSGIYAQCLFKQLWQQSIQQRIINEKSQPAFLWIDESHFFINERDTIFQTTARSSMACTVLLTQNISNYHMQMGGKNVKAKVDSLLGNLGTLIFHNNSDAVTNEWASRLIGNSIQQLQNSSQSEGFLSLNFQSNQGITTQYLPQIQPRDFTTLKSGGIHNEYEVEGYVFITGKNWAWSDNKNYSKIIFKQFFKK